MLATRSPCALVIGAGPAGLYAAETLASGGVGVLVVDAMPSPGRKFLMAGRGGLNLTHSEPLPGFLDRYGPARALLEPTLRAFPPQALIDWCEGLGQPTFIGSSGRVFPCAMKASPLLRAWLRRLEGLGVGLRSFWRWRGWDDSGACRFDTPDGPRDLRPGVTVLALGGASWPRLGSDGAWPRLLDPVRVVAWRPANCGVVVHWSDLFRARFAGAPLKRIAVGFAGRTVRGEAVITTDGLEGGAVYALSAPVRDALERGGPVSLRIDLRPDLSHARLAAQLDGPRGAATLSARLRKAGLPPVGIGLVQEALHAGVAADSLAGLVKAVPISVQATKPLERAISAAGGIAREEIDPHFMLHRRPGVFVAGEMLDWEAPTGGYLLQACFSTGAAAGRGALRWLEMRKA